VADWVELRRYDDNLEADIALHFLRDHGISVKLLGNSGQTSVLNRFSTIVDIRLMVPKKSLKRARRTLHAMTDADVERVPEAEEDPEGASGHPYRGGHKREEVHPRYRRAAIVLAFLLPIGSGHIYSRHDTTGAVLAVSIVSLAASAVVSGTPWLFGACVVLVICDAIGSLRAVREHNDRTMPATSVQFWRGVRYVVFALVLAWLASRVTEPAA
jgi:hypothetical protein